MMACGDATSVLVRDEILRVKWKRTTRSHVFCHLDTICWSKTILDYLYFAQNSVSY